MATEKKPVEKAVEVETSVEVKIAEAKNHSIFLAGGKHVQFVEGVAVVDAATAKELKDGKYIV